jgi:hypothetical protein
MDRSRRQSSVPQNSDVLREFLLGLTHLRNKYLMSADMPGLLVIPSLAFIIRTESLEEYYRLYYTIAAYTVLCVVIKWGLFFANASVSSQRRKPSGPNWGFEQGTQGKCIKTELVSEFLCANIGNNVLSPLDEHREIMTQVISVT